ncbi:hypothetical protein ACIBHY_52705 [Nonomuraea sp. NPDC050547]|uniref:hypothetical protein n=1 Tax=Nonomuraea sp. NPDC050547 TaxID=3364368 RepID=UPI0037B54D30
MAALALTSVLVSPGDLGDLGEIDARKLKTFATHYELAWLSLHGARTAIRRALTAMDRSRPQADPARLATFTPAHHSGSLMHALRDLHLYADTALALPDSNVRTRAPHHTLLATVQPGQGDPDAACATGRQTLSAYPHHAGALMQVLRRGASR